MEKVYNLSELFKENEFDAQKGYNRCGTKEAYFSVLYRFTLDAGRIIRLLSPEKYESGDINIDEFLRNTDRLQGMLANIGAVGLVWKMQSLNYLAEKKFYGEYVRQFGEILPDVDLLRKRIIMAEKSESPAKDSSSWHDSVHTAVADNESAKARLREKPRMKPRRLIFNKLLMLIDNFEFESAWDAAKSIMCYTYGDEIDNSLEEFCKALDEFNHSKALSEAQKLYALAICAEEAENPIKKNILAIDDMPDVLRTVKAMLSDRYNVFCATTYETALKYLRSYTADLIILDIEMPGIDGFAMMQLLRKLPECEKTPVVFLTSNVSDSHIRTALKLGARDFIKKPVNLDVLVHKLEKAISTS